MRQADIGRDSLRGFGESLVLIRLLEAIRDIAGAVDARVARVLDQGPGDPDAASAELVDVAGADGGFIRPVFRWAGAKASAEEYAGHRLVRLPLGRTGDGRLELHVTLAAGRALAETTRATLASLTPALLECIVESRRSADSERRAAVAEAGLDAQSVSTILLDCAGEIIFANAAAEQLLARHFGLRRHGRSLRTTTLRDTVKLRTGLAEVGSGEHRAVSFTLEASGEARLFATMTAADAEPEPTCIVMHVVDPAADFAPGVTAICHLLGLSKAETDIVTRLASNSTVDDVAEMAGMKVSTVRSHLRSIFLKSGAHTQSDLIRQVLRSLSPAIFTSSFALR